jgi:hypothetical protein
MTMLEALEAERRHDERVAICPLAQRTVCDPRITRGGLRRHLETTHDVWTQRELDEITREGRRLAQHERRRHRRRKGDR